MKDNNDYVDYQMKVLENYNIEYTTDINEDYDILNINFYDMDSYRYAKKMKKIGKKIICFVNMTDRSLKDTFLFSNIFSMYLIEFYRLCDMLVVPNEYTKYILERYNLSANIIILPEYIEQIEIGPKDKTSFRRKYHLKIKDKVIISRGEYYKRDGIIDFIKLAKEYPNYKFIWFGKTPLKRLSISVKRAINTKLDNLIFANDVDYKIINKALNSSDLYLSLSNEEVSDKNVKEAQLNKIPVLVKNISIYKEYKDIYKANTYKGIKENIETILSIEVKSLKSKIKIKNTDKQLIKIYKETMLLEKKKPKINYQYFKSLSLILGTIIIFLTMLFSTNGFKDINNIMPIKEYSDEFKCMDKVIKIKIYTSDPYKAKRALKEVKTLYKGYDNISNDEILSLVNSNELDTIDPKLYNMIKYGINWYELSNGYININSANLINLWKSKLPTAEELDDIKYDINDIKLLDNNKIEGNLNIDLSHIKFGYATKKIEDALYLLGVKNYIIETDGLITTGMYYENNGSYKVKINSPFKKDNKLLDTINLDNQSVAYTTLYQDYVTYDEIDYSLIINPMTKKSSNNFIGVTVISDDSSEAYTLSRILFMMDIEEGKEYLEEYDNVKVIWSYIDSKGNNKNKYSDNYNK